MTIETRLYSSLTKLFADEDPHDRVTERGSALQGEIYSFQVAVRPDEGVRITLAAQVDSPFGPAVHLYVVRQVPSTLAVYPWSDDNYLRTTPGLYPDLLMPYTDVLPVVVGQWRSLWVEVRVPETMAPGVYPIRITLSDTDHPDVRQETTFSLEIIGARLPEQTLIHTEWFHNDCLAVQYGVPVFSEEHWALIGRYMENAARYGVNMILTPVFTPPLDTAVGAERPTVQLVDVTVDGEGYRFGFDRLKRYMDLAWTCGMRYFEISHLFTQWGAAAAPKIVGMVDGTEQRLFGWDTPADSAAYRAFLSAFLPALKDFLRREGRLDRCAFHLSDEPSLANIDSYRRAREIVAPLLEGCRQMDALSDFDFYQRGLVPHPVPSNDRVEEFVQGGVKDCWTYYCCGQVNGVSNRMMAMPSARNRILGFQLYKFGIAGFLHWGYNFWFSRLSKHPIDPFFCTDAEDAFPSGDPYLVYPGEGGQPLPSIRQLVFHEGLQDMRALQLLATLMPPAELTAWLDSRCGQPLTFREYPHSADWLLDTREAINRRIQERMGA